MHHTHSRNSNNVLNYYLWIILHRVKISSINRRYIIDLFSSRDPLSEINDNAHSTLFTTTARASRSRGEKKREEYKEIFQSNKTQTKKTIPLKETFSVKIVKSAFHRFV